MAEYHGLEPKPGSHWADGPHRPCGRPDGTYWAYGRNRPDWCDRTYWPYRRDG